MNSPFRVAVINDEITQDFGHACEIAAHEFGMEWIELRGMWNKNLLKLDAKEVDEARRILERNKLRVTATASPLVQGPVPQDLVSTRLKSTPPIAQEDACCFTDLTY